MTIVVRKALLADTKAFAEVGEKTFRGMDIGESRTSFPAK